MILLFLLLVYRKFFAISAIIPIMMAIGIASEYTILMMERFVEERRNGHGRYTKIQRSIQKIGTAMTISGMTTFFGFFARLLSSFPIISNFGLVTVAAVGFSVLGAIVVMPAVIAVMDRRNQEGQTSPVSGDSRAGE